MCNCHDQSFLHKFLPSSNIWSFIPFTWSINVTYCWRRNKWAHERNNNKNVSFCRCSSNPNASCLCGFLPGLRSQLFRSFFTPNHVTRKRLTARNYRDLETRLYSYYFSIEGICQWWRINRVTKLKTFVLVDGVHLISGRKLPTLSVFPHYAKTISIAPEKR